MLRLVVSRALPVLVVLAGCSVDFDPAGRACDSEGECIEGYTCRGGLCVLVGAEADAGFDASADLGDDDLGPVDLGSDAGVDVDLGFDIGPSDAGDSDLGPGDGGPPDLGPPPPCMRSTTLLCEDYDSGAAPTFFTSDGSMSMSLVENAGQSHRGRGYARARGDGGWAQHILSLPASNGGTLHVRMFVQIPSSVSFTGDPMNSALALLEMRAGGDFIEMGIGANEGLYVDPSSAATPFPTYSGARTLPRDTWLCVRARLPIGTSETIHFEVGSTSLDHGGADTSAFADAGERMVVGIPVAHTGGASNREVWVDSIVLSRAPVGCDE